MSSPVDNKFTPPLLEIENPICISKIFSRLPDELSLKILSYVKLKFLDLMVNELERNNRAVAIAEKVQLAKGEIVEFDEQKLLNKNWYRIGKEVLYRTLTEDYNRSIALLHHTYRLSINFLCKIDLTLPDRNTLQTFMQPLQPNNPQRLALITNFYNARFNGDIDKQAELKLKESFKIDPLLEYIQQTVSRILISKNNNSQLEIFNNYFLHVLANIGTIDPHFHYQANLFQLHSLLNKIQQEVEGIASLMQKQDLPSKNATYSILVFFFKTTAMFFLSSHIDKIDLKEIPSLLNLLTESIQETLKNTRFNHEKELVHIFLQKLFDSLALFTRTGYHSNLLEPPVQLYTCQNTNFTDLDPHNNLKMELPTPGIHWNAFNFWIKLESPHSDLLESLSVDAYLTLFCIQNIQCINKFRDKPILENVTSRCEFVLYFIKAMNISKCGSEISKEIGNFLLQSLDINEDSHADIQECQPLIDCSLNTHTQFDTVFNFVTHVLTSAPDIAIEILLLSNFEAYIPELLKNQNFIRLLQNATAQSQYSSSFRVFIEKYKPFSDEIMVSIAQTLTDNYALLCRQLGSVPEIAPNEIQAAFNAAKTNMRIFCFHIENTTHSDLYYQYVLLNNLTYVKTPKNLYRKIVANADTYTYEQRKSLCKNYLELHSSSSWKFLEIFLKFQLSEKDTLKVIKKCWRMGSVQRRAQLDKFMDDPEFPIKSPKILIELKNLPIRGIKRKPSQVDLPSAKRSKK